MSNKLYAIKDSTLTAIGDILREKTEKKYIYTNEYESGPIFEAYFDSEECEEIVLNRSGTPTYHLYFPFHNYTEAIGDKIDLTTKIYVEYDYEVIKPSASTSTYSCSINLNLHNQYPPDPNTVFPYGTMNIYSNGDELIGSGTGFWNGIREDFPYHFLTMIINETSYNEGLKMKAHIRLWPCNDEGEFIELNKFNPLEMADAINGLDTKPPLQDIVIDENGTYSADEGYYGIGSVEVNTMSIPNSASIITGDCQYKFSANGWNWFIDIMGDELKTNNISGCYYMFSNSSNLTHIPFDINITKGLITIAYCFNGCGKLEEVPYIIGPADKALPTSSYSGCITLDHLFQSCQFLRYIPDDYFWKIVPNEAYWAKWRELSSQTCNSLFQNCYSLRKLPDISMLGAKEAYYGALYNNMCYQCFNLDEITNLPVSGASFTSNAFSSIVQSCYRLKDFIFATNEDGTPKTAPWKGQTIDLSKIGYGYAQYNLQQAYNSGITEATRVKDDATYQALKDNPDYFTHDVNYSRYNHTSAVRTINSLPDCSATGTNTIKFNGSAGALTDGGAINTLTEEEIAVATAKGWTISFA